MTPFSHYTNDELLSIVFTSEEATPLELELAFRLENSYAADVRDEYEEPVVHDFEDLSIGKYA